MEGFWIIFCDGALGPACAEASAGKQRALPKLGR